MRNAPPSGRPPARAVPAPLLAADPPAAPGGAGGERGERAGERGGVLAPPGQAAVPRPGEADGLGDGLLPAAGAADVAEVDAGVPLDARQERQEAGL